MPLPEKSRNETLTDRSQDEAWGWISGKAVGIVKIACPSCGGSTEIHPSDRFIRCAYCDSILYIELGESLVKTIFKIKVSNDRIPGILDRGLKQHLMPESFSVRSTYLFLFPFWKFTSETDQYFSPATTTTDTCIEKYIVESGEQEYLADVPAEDIDVIEPDIFLENALDRLRLPPGTDPDSVRVLRRCESCIESGYNNALFHHRTDICAISAGNGGSNGYECEVCCENAENRMRVSTCGTGIYPVL